MNNIFKDIPPSLPEEIITKLLSNEQVRIERILSRGQTSPTEGWYEQHENEWVLLIQGAAIIEFDNTEDVYLSAGDHITIPKMQKHRVKWTEPTSTSIWLAVFYH